MNFSFISPGQLIVQRGGLSDIGTICSKYGKRAGIFRFGESFFTSGIYNTLKESLSAACIEHFVYPQIEREPSAKTINACAQFLQEHQCDFAIAIGGGSVIDVAKAACALAANGSDIMDYVEGFDPKPFANSPLPIIAVPTTAGTGSECTKNSVVTEAGSFKNSVRDDKMMPSVSLLDATLMTGVNREVTATAGADAICQLVEAYVSSMSNPMTDALSLHFIKMAIPALKRVYQNGNDLDSREAMALSASASGLCIANGGLGAAHGIAAGIGAITGLKHGFLCGVLLPPVMRYNIKKGTYKYADIARSLGMKLDNDHEASLALVEIIQELNHEIGLPKNLKGLNIREEDIPSFVEIACSGSSMKKNPFPMPDADCSALIQGLL